MKTNVLRIALLAAMMGIATLANAQAAFEYVSTAPVGTTHSVDSNHVDYVTIGATMPYRTNTTQAGLATWKASLLALGLTVDTVTSSTAWSIGGTPLVANVDEIQVKWNTLGSYKLLATTSIKVGSTAGCADAVSAKTIYVLSAPKFELTTGNNAVLPCTANTHNVKYKVSGIGIKQVKFTLTRTPLGESGVVEAQKTENVGSIIADASYFADSKAIASAGAEGAYGLTNAAEYPFQFSGLQAGYIYTATVDEVSDQISRKSGVTVNPVVDKIVFAIAPKPTSTKIEHVKNVE